MNAAELPPTTDCSTVNKETSAMNPFARRNNLARRLLLLGLVALASLTAFGSGAGSADAAEPVIRVTGDVPDKITPGKWMVMFVGIQNEGDAPMSGNLTFRYAFDNGLPIGPFFPQADGGPEAVCTPSGQEAECTLDVTGIPPGRLMRYRVVSLVDAGASGILNGEVEVSGGGAANTPTLPLSFDTGPSGPFEFKSFEMEITDQPSLPTAQAGSHPREVTTSATFYSRAVTAYDFDEYYFYTIVSPPESFRNLVTHLPVGFIGSPTATPSRCTAAQLSTLDYRGANPQMPVCPRDSQVGIALLDGKDIAPIYNIVPRAGVPAEFGLYYQGVTVNILAKLRPSDDGIDLYTVQAPTADRLPLFELTFWGTPAASVHDNLRAECTINLDGASGQLCPLASSARTPFVRLPTSCSGAPLPWEMEMDTYEHPGVYHRRSATTPAATGCDSVPFDPKVSLASTDSSAHSTSGLGVDLSIPQDSGPDGIANADVRSVSLALPQGVGLNPSAAEGLAACTDAQLRIDVEGPAQCPESSKLGTVEVDTPLLNETLGGSVYLRTQNSQDPESGEMYRLAIVLHSAERGVDVKLPGSLVVNKATGQLTTTFDDLPQLPFESMQLHLKTGPRAPLTTPQACGTYASQATLTGWNGKTVSLEPSISVNQGCDAPGFKPGFQAGVADPTAGEFSPFTLRVTRGSGQPNLSRIEATLPEGELAKLAGVPVCSDAQAAAVSCPASSRIGRVVSGIGEGSSPLYLPQPGKAPTAVYLAGPYKGAPYSVLATVPAQSGPFDLGTVAVRSTLRVDPTTTRASVQSDPLPQIYGGIPVSYRDVQVMVDRPEFTLNPTGCEPKSVEGEIASNQGDVAHVSDRFQASDCASLGFKPKLALALKGATRRGANPALTATLRMRKGANVAGASVALPHSAFLDQAHIKTICTRVQFAADGGGGAGCPAASVYGHATAFTPLLDQPLEGPVYLRSSNHNLPDLVASLDGAIHVDLAGRIDSFHSGIRTSFEAVPDAPVTKFVLAMRGGKKGLIQNSRDLCLGASRAVARFDGQNGRAHDFRPLVKPTSCAGNARKKHRRG